jgi:hypothetical protein
MNPVKDNSTSGKEKQTHRIHRNTSRIGHRLAIQQSSQSYPSIIHLQRCTLQPSHER